jgi:hypothetical protein
MCRNSEGSPGKAAFRSEGTSTIAAMKDARQGELKTCKNTD